MSKTPIPSKIVNQLLVKSAGRCQYRGCNDSLYIDLVTKRNFNQSYIAHIVADEPGGPRGDSVRSILLAKDLNNLMLLCDRHHRLIDKEEVEIHTESVLLEMKKDHEERIERVTAISPNMQSHILTYRANVGVHTREISYQTVSQYLHPEYYPAISDTIDLSLSNSVECDKDDSFWQNEVANLEKQFNRKLHQSFSKGEIKHLSVFAFAPIPLLVKLGTLINDIYLTDIYQPVRNPTTWKLTNDPATITYKVIPPLVKHKVVALNISLSATINNERITSILGDDCAIYTLTIDAPFNDYLKSKKELAAFSQIMRKLFNQIKTAFDENIPIHIFPAMPIATAIELGRVWMPKADMPLFIYDQNTATGGFKKVIEIHNT
jgi:hypothetical protein